MKTRCLIFLMFIFLISCHKNETTGDYRDKYVGTYKCKGCETIHGTDLGTRDFQFEYTPFDGDSTMGMYGLNGYMYIHVCSNGEFYETSNSQFYITPDPHGRFYGDSVVIYDSGHALGGGGISWNNVWKGCKLKEKDSSL